MCELLGLSANKKRRINDSLEIFFSHSFDHRDGWGIALLDSEKSLVNKAPEKAFDSSDLKNALESDIYSAGLIAHIRKASIGGVDEKNTHPFVKCDNSGREWVLAHNGTIFESDILAPYQYSQSGTSDSERILLYITDMINKNMGRDAVALREESRIKAVDEAIRAIVPGNKVNLLIYDGYYLYVHTNDPGTLYKRYEDGGALFATRPLGVNGWEEIPLNRLQVYREGSLVCEGIRHNNTYVNDERKKKLLYVTYSGL